VLWRSRGLATSHVPQAKHMQHDQLHDTYTTSNEKVSPFRYIYNVLLYHYSVGVQQNAAGSVVLKQYIATVNFCCFRCATTSPITAFYKLRFLHLFSEKAKTVL